MIIFLILIVFIICTCIPFLIKDNSIKKDPELYRLTRGVYKDINKSLLEIPKKRLAERLRDRHEQEILHAIDELEAGDFQIGPFIVVVNNGNIDNNGNIEFINTEVNNIIKTTEGQKVIIKNDQQNVHDHLVTNTIKSTIEKLQKETKLILSIEDVIKDIHQEIIKHADTHPKWLSINLDNYKNEKLMAYNISELEALQLVWNRIKQISVNNFDLMSSLFNSLLDGNKSCISGRFNRIIDSLNILDPLVTIKPIWALQQEMLDKASVIRKELLLSQPVEIQEQIENNENLTEKFNKDLKTLIKIEFKKIYCDTLILTESELSNELGKWIDYI